MVAADPSKSFETLDVQIRGLDADVRDLKDGFAGLDAKIDKSIASLAHEFRTAVSSLSNQFTERQRTPWGVLISAAMAIVGVLAIVGSQAMAPLQQEIKYLKDNSFPREEAVFRYGINDKRLNGLEAARLVAQERRFNELIRQIERLETDNRELRRVPRGAP